MHTGHGIADPIGKDLTPPKDLYFGIEQATDGRGHGVHHKAQTTKHACLAQEPIPIPGAGMVGDLIPQAFVLQKNLGTQGWIDPMGPGLNTDIVGLMNRRPRVVNFPSSGGQVTGRWRKRSMAQRLLIVESPRRQSQDQALISNDNFSIGRGALDSQGRNRHSAVSLDRKAPPRFVPVKVITPYLHRVH